MKPKPENTSKTDLAGYEVLVAVCGGIAAYKVCQVASELVQRGAGVSVAMTKAAMYKGLHEHDLAAHMDYEVYIMNILFSTEDFKEGMTSLWEKRDATFKGR